MYYGEVKAGDIVLCWRPSFILPSYYKAKVVEVVGDVWRVKPLYGIFRFKRWVGGVGKSGVVRRA